MKRIAWVSPLDSNSAIGRHSLEVCNELSKSYEIEIIYPDCDNVINNKFSNKKISSVRSNIDALDGYDYIIYNLGNNNRYHSEIYDLLRVKKGIVVLHDQTMFDFFFMELSEKNNGVNFINSYLSFAGQYYSNEERKFLLGVLEGSNAVKYNENSISILNMLLPIINFSTGIYTHALFFVNMLREYYSRPIGCSYLTCERKIKSDSKEIFKFIPEDDRALIVSSGHVNLYKRIDKVVDVLIKEKNVRDNIKYVVIGDTNEEYAKKLIEISKNELKGILYMLGYQSEEVMESAIYNSDLCINLRYPNSEVCSLSVLEQMINGKPVCVTNKGFFKELPNNSVIKINLENETEEIKNVLKNLISNRNFYNDIGTNAKEFVEENCNITTYVDNFIKFLDECDKYDYIEDDYINNFIDNVSEKYNHLGITQENGKKYIDIAVERLNRIINK